MEAGSTEPTTLSMHCLQNEIPPPTMRHLRSPFASTRILPLLLPLGVLCLLTAGCSTTHQVSHDAPRAHSRVTEAAQSETAHVHLADGRTLEWERLYMRPDSTSGRTPEGAEQTVSTSTVRKVEFVNRGIGFFQGAGLGGASVLGSGLLLSRTADDEFGRDLGALASVVLAVPTALLGGIIGAANGHRETYRFSGDSLATAAEEVPTPHEQKPKSSQSAPSQ